MERKKIHFLASEKHFFDHLKNIFLNCDKEKRGYFFISENILDYVKKFIDNDDEIKIFEKNYDLFSKIKKDILLCCSYGDINKTNIFGIKQILMEHGAGQCYQGVNSSSYASGCDGDKSNVILYLATNKRTAEEHKKNYPFIPVEIIGCSPKMDEFLNKNKKCGRKKKNPLIAISFHWDCQLCPETKTSFYYYKDVLKDLNKEFNLIGHGHPRIINELKQYYKDFGIKVIEDFNFILENCDLYICDNSSTIFEFACLDKPVVLLNAPFYRRTINHGLRFWDCADIGLQCNEPKDLVNIIKEALKDTKEQKQRRQEALKKVYEYIDGKSTERALKFIYRQLSEIDDGEKEIFRYYCSQYPFLIISSLNVKFQDGYFETDNKYIANEIDKIIEKKMIDIERI